MPALRFPEFEGEWEKRKFGTLNEIIDSLHQTPKEYIEVGYAMIRVTDVNDGNLNIEKCLKVSKDIFNEFTKRYSPKKDDIIMSRVGTCGATIKLNSNKHVCLGQNTVLLIPKIDKGFVFKFMKSRFFQNQVDSMVVGSTQKTLSLKDLKNFNFNIPSLPEQQKIASFLSAVDEKIQQLTRKATLLEQYKKGIMQQLFSGKLRFKDDNVKDFPEWEEKKLGDVAKYYDGTHQTPTYVENGIPFYSVEHLTANQFSKSKYISEEVFEKENKRVKLEKDDILMTRIGDIGTSRLIDWEVKASFYVSLALIKHNNKFNSSFLNQYISSINFQKEIWARTIHVAFPKKINLGEIGNCKIKLPSIKEQQKIASFLSEIDNKIDSVNGQLEKTQTFKKGLLQGMFV